MDSAKNDELLYDFSPTIRVYKDGRVERLQGTEVVRPSTDTKTGVQSKDVTISAFTGVSARLYLPSNTPSGQKLPLLIYFHGGAFFIESPFSPAYHNYLNSVVSRANVVAVSVNYRKAPEHPLPICYEDSWEALKWVGSHSDGTGSEEWLNEYADLEHVYLAGNSAGANIAHNMGMRFGGGEKLGRVKIAGIALVHPYFWGEDPIENETQDPNIRGYIKKLWMLACPESSGCDDELMNPVTDKAKLASLGCDKVLVCVAEKDLLKPRGLQYYEVLGKSGWRGTAEIMETKDESHEFHLSNPESENAAAMIERIASFVNPK